MATAKTKTKKSTTRQATKGLQAPLYDSAGKKKGEVALPKELFGVRWNSALVHQVVTAQQANARTPVAHAKDRSEVRGGGRKPWRQKGTGRARHGSRRSPIWVGGGVTHGPLKTKNYSQKINKKMRIKALAAVLSKKYADGEILFIDSLGLTEPKTAQAKEILAALAGVKGYEALATKKHNAALIALDTHDLNTKRSFANMGNVAVDEVRNLNPVELLRHKYLIIVHPELSLNLLKERVKK